MLEENNLKEKFAREGSNELDVTFIKVQFGAPLDRSTDVCCSQISFTLKN